MHGGCCEDSGYDRAMLSRRNLSLPSRSLSKTAHRSPRRSRGAQGQVAVVVALMSAVLLGFAGLAVDSNLLVGVDQQDQHTADAASLAAAYYIYANPLGTTANATAYGNKIAVRDGCTGSCSIAYTFLDAGGLPVVGVVTTVKKVQANVTDNRRTTFRGLPYIPTVVSLKPVSNALVTVSGGSFGYGISCALCVLNSGSDAVNIVAGANNTTWDTNSGDINVNGGFTNSATGTDLLLGSGGKFNVVGTCSGCGSFETLPTVPAPGLFADPLAAPAISYPTWTGATPRFAGSAGGKAPPDGAAGTGCPASPLLPGIYQDLWLGATNCTVNFTPGVYIFPGQHGDNAGINIWGINDSLTCTTCGLNGVTLFFTCGSMATPTLCSAGGDGAQIVDEGKGATGTTWALHAPTDPLSNFYNMLIFYDRNDASDIELWDTNTGGSNTGVLYGASARLLIEGTGLANPLGSPVIVNTVYCHHGGFALNANGSAGYNPGAHVPGNLSP
jgi:Putative Flp pilus-assembly TadE/G-like